MPTWPTFLVPSQLPNTGHLFIRPTSTLACGLHDILQGLLEELLKVMSGGSVRQTYWQDPVDFVGTGKSMALARIPSRSVFLPSLPSPSQNRTSVLE